MTAIVAVDLNWGIGYQGRLLERIPEDQKFFKQTTIGKVVVMGRETFESLPGQEPLNDRVNIVLSSKADFGEKKVTVCHSLRQLFQELTRYPNDDIFIIGGEMVYTQLLPFCDEAYVTKIKNFYQADKHFINLDMDDAWEKVSQSASKNYNNVEFSFEKYINKCLKKDKP